MRYSIEQKPSNINEYKIWASKYLQLDERAANYYNNVAKQMKEQYENSFFWKQLLHNIKICEEKYLQTTKYELIQSNFIPKILVKEYDSFIDKCFRKNVILNKDWPEEPPYGWITHLNAYEKIGDIVRTNFLVRYLDGVDWLIECLTQTCNECNNEYLISYQAKEDGYYAAHFDTIMKFEIPTLSWQTEKIQGRVEIQVTTLLKDVIKKLIHNVYRNERTVLEDLNDYKWQWDYKNDKFNVNYLGHILHYLEGTIMEIRDRRLK